MTYGWQINTAFIARLNLNIRQRGAAIGRRVHTLCWGEHDWQHQLVVSHVYHNCCLPHASLLQPLLRPDPQRHEFSQAVTAVHASHGG